uniref:Fe/B12 periplasmic-binding domain-containing protein n=1 Tax=Rhodosorus marinus TaxID=101924 RepID=A0A7S2ZAX7_9RHOD|mmetsp:Transcript_11360/g.47324  ORF Transcript_11360/g.47324 Transcript_11360/m.47324 type:complete len:348 (+) Transcript_11360:100-1143(+)
MKRVVSLVPAGTETLIELGCLRNIVGVSHGSEWEISGVKAVTRAKFDEEGLTSEEISALFKVSCSEGMLYGLEGGAREEVALVRMRLCSYFWTEPEVLASLDPDVVVTVVDGSEMAGFDDIRWALRTLLNGKDVEIINFNPYSMAQTFKLTKEIAQVVGIPEEGLDYVRDYQTRLQNIANREVARRIPSVVTLQWLEPLYVSGTWTPELVRYAGGRSLFCRPGEPSKAVTWSEMNKENPDIVIFCLCGLSIEGSVNEVRRWFLESAVDRRQPCYAVHFTPLLTRRLYVSHLDDRLSAFRSKVLSCESFWRSLSIEFMSSTREGCLASPPFVLLLTVQRFWERLWRIG